MKKANILIIAILSALTVIFSALTTLTFFSEDYIRSRHKVAYLTKEYDIASEKLSDFYDKDYSEDYLTNSMKNMYSDTKEKRELELNEAKEDLAPIQTRGVVFGIIAGCFLFVLVIYLVVILIKKSSAKKVMNN